MLDDSRNSLEVARIGTKFESLHENSGNIAMTLVLVPGHPRSIRILVSV